MRRRLIPLGTVALLLLPAAALGEEPRARLRVEPRLGIVALGTETPTGGLAAGVSAKVLLPVGDATQVYAGAGAELIGLTGGWYHMGVVAGPRVGAIQRWGAFELGGGLGALYGQLTTCRPWADLYRQCMRWWNVWPEATLRASYVAEDVRVGVEFSALYLNVPFGATIGGGLAAVGSFR